MIYRNNYNRMYFRKLCMEPEDDEAVRMLSINPQTGMKMIHESDPELQEIFEDDEEIIFSLRIRNIYLSCAKSDLVYVGKRIYLMGTGVAYKLNPDDDYADMGSDEMAQVCLDLFGRMQRVWMTGFGFPVLDLSDMEGEKNEEEK